MLEIDYYDLIEILKKENNPFSRKNYLGKIKNNFGMGNYIWYDIGSGIAISITTFKLYQDTIISQTSTIAGTVLIFNFANDFTYTFKDKNKYLSKKDSFFLGFSSNNFSAKMQFKKNTSYSIFTIGMKEELFLKLPYDFKNLENKRNEANKKNYAIIEGGSIDPEQLDILTYFFNKKFDEYLFTDLFLESNIANLIQYTYKKIIKNINSNSNMDENIIKSLEKAKQIILSEYFSNTLSIKEIAYKSAINECYLKKDFKNYYKMTIYEMIQKQRLEEAKKLLKKDFSVKEACIKVGYKHTGHFSKLFFNYFGITPSSYRKQFKTYWFFLFLDIFFPFLIINYW